MYKEKAIISDEDKKFVVKTKEKTKETAIITDKNKKSVIKKDDRKEVQKHGFIWEKNILCNIYGATTEELGSISYVSKIDLPAKYNRLNGCDMSVKTTKSKNSVCMGDCLRVYDTINTGKILHMVVLHYIQKGNIKTLNSIVEIDLTNSIDILFGNITRDQLVELDKIVKCVPQKRKPTYDEHKKMYEYRNKLLNKKGQIMLNIKCNRQQSRLQCSFNKFTLFIKSFPERVISQSNNNIFRGNEIINEIISPPRKFNK